MFRTIGDGPSCGSRGYRRRVLRLPEDLARVDALLDDPVFFAPARRPNAGARFSSGHCRCDLNAEPGRRRDPTLVLPVGDIAAQARAGR